jgi:predicted dehydrogenase
MPAYLKVAQIMAESDFGGVSSFSYRYPLILPPQDERDNDLAMAPFLDFARPFALLVRLFGECQGFTYMRSKAGDVVMNLSYRNGVVGTLHLTGGQAATSPLERLEVIGSGANVVVENCVELTYYRAGGRRGGATEAGTASFVGPDPSAPIVWEPEFSLGQRYNKQLILQGYVGAINYFAQQVLEDRPPKHGNLVDILHIMTVHDRLVGGAEHEWIQA